MTTITTTQAQGFLALVPYLLGVQPRESVVLVAFDGTRSCGALRLELGAGARESRGQAERSLATTVIGMLCRLPRADGLAIVVYPREEFGGEGSLPAQELVEVIIERAHDSGFAIRDAFCVASDAWGSYLDVERPRVRRSLALIEESVVIGELSAHDRSNAVASVDAQLSLPELSEVERAEFARQATGSVGDAELWTLGGQGDGERMCGIGRFVDRLLGSGGQSEVDGVGTESNEPHERLPVADRLCIGYERGADEGVGRDDLVPGDEFGSDRQRGVCAPASSRDISQLIVLCRASANRDSVLVTMGWGGGMAVRTRAETRVARAESGGDAAAVDAVGSGGQGRIDGVDAGALLSGRGVEKPDRLRLIRAIELLRWSCAVATDADRATMLSMLAWLHWARGAGSVAVHWLRQARQFDPDYQFAALLEGVIRSGHLPEWVFGRNRG